jgi:hypothetical protein
MWGRLAITASREVRWGASRVGALPKRVKQYLSTPP